MIGHNPSTPAGAGEAVAEASFHRKYGQRYAEYTIYSG